MISDPNPVLVEIVLSVFENYPKAYYVFSFAPMFANDWLTACDGFYDASACWLSHMKQ